MSRYNKFIVALVGLVITGFATFAGIDFAAQGVTVDAVMALVVPVLTAFGVWAVPNTEV